MQEDMEARTRVRNLVISIATCVGLVILAWFYSEPVLRISVLPDGPPFVIKRQMKTLTDYLEQKIGMKVEFRPMRNGDALVESLAAKELDLAWVDGAHLIQARLRSKDGVTPIVERAEDDQAPSAPAAANPDHAYRWVIRAGLDTDLQEKLTDAFLTMHTDKAKGSEFMQYQHASRYIPASAAKH